MSEYISRDDALNFEMEIEAEPEEIQAISRGMALMSEHIKGLPAADVTECKAGEWKYDPEYGWCVCSSCDGYVVLKSMKDHYNFCPNCGARMRQKDGVE